MSAKFTISDEWGIWTAKMERLSKGVSEEFVDEWTATSELFFSRSQDYAHVLSGDMKASGRLKVSVESPQLLTEVEYTVPYAAYEHDRGGSHAYLARAWESTESLMSQAFPEAWERMWR